MSQSEMKISFDVRDKESLHREMPGKAVMAARNNAGILVKAAGVRRGTIVNIKYGWSEVRFREGMDMGATMICESLPDIEPEEIDGRRSGER